MLACGRVDILCQVLFSLLRYLFFSVKYIHTQKDFRKTKKMVRILLGCSGSYGGVVTLTRILHHFVISGDAHSEAARQNGPTQWALPELPEPPHRPLGPT